MKQNFVQGAMILVVAGLITRGLGTIYRIFLSRYLGAEAIGIYQMAFPTLIMLITIVTAGLPIAVSKLVAEADAKHDPYLIKRILRTSLGIVMLVAIVVSSLFYFLIPLLTKYLLTDERVYLTLLAIVPIVPIISVSAILRGYFQGKQNMIPTAISNIIKTIFRMIAGMFLSLKFLPLGVEYAAFGAMLGMIVGEIAGFIILVAQYFFSKKGVKRPTVPLPENRNALFNNIARIAVPVTTSSIIGSLAYFIEPSVVANSLALAGIPTGTATALYGQLAGMALLIITFPTVITSSLGQSLIPAISEAAAKKNVTKIYKRLHQALNIAYIIGLPSSVLLFVLANPLAELLFNTKEVGHLIKIISPFAIFLYIQRPLAATLQGLDRAKDSMTNTIIGAVVKTLAIVFLASRPSLGIDGVAMAINIGMLLVTVLHFRSVIHIIGYTIQVRPILSITGSALTTGYIAYYIMFHSLAKLSQGISLLAATAISIVAYIYILLFLKVIKKQDFEKIPWLGSKITKILP